MAVYRFNVEAKISQVVAINADTREEALEALKEVVDAGTSARSPKNLNDIKTDLRKLGEITEVKIDQVASRYRDDYESETRYLHMNQLWSKNNPEKREDGMWDEEIYFKLNPKHSHDLQLFIELPQSSNSTIFGKKMTVNHDGKAYGEIRDLTTEEYDMVVKHLKEEYDVVPMFFDITKLLDHTPRVERMWHAFSVRPKRTVAGHRCVPMRTLSFQVSSAKPLTSDELKEMFGIR